MPIQLQFAFILEIDSGMKDNLPTEFADELSSFFRDFHG